MSALASDQDRAARAAALGHAARLEPGQARRARADDPRRCGPTRPRGRARRARARRYASRRRDRVAARGVGPRRDGAPPRGGACPCARLGDSGAGGRSRCSPTTTRSPRRPPLSRSANARRAGPRVLDALSRAASTHDDALVREAAVAALGAIGDAGTLAVVLARVRRQARGAAARGPRARGVRRAGGRGAAADRAHRPRLAGAPSRRRSPRLAAAPAEPGVRRTRGPPRGIRRRRGRAGRSGRDAGGGRCARAGGSGAGRASPRHARTRRRARARAAPRSWARTSCRSRR